MIIYTRRKIPNGASCSKCKYSEYMFAFNGNGKSTLWCNVHAVDCRNVCNQYRPRDPYVAKSSPRTVKKCKYLGKMHYTGKNSRWVKWCRLEAKECDPECPKHRTKK